VPLANRQKPGGGRAVNLERLPTRSE
jgi:hypothetical protein